MAANDLMMRIQLLVQSGKSSAELNRLQRALKDLQRQLSELDRTRLAPLTRDLDSVKRAAVQLRTVNLSNFATSLDEVKKSFSGLGIGISTLDSLRTAYQNLNAQLSSGGLARYQQEILRLQSALRDTRTREIIPLQNEIRKLSAQKGVDKAVKMDTLTAQTRTARAQLRFLANELKKIDRINVGGSLVFNSAREEAKYKSISDSIKKLNDDIVRNDLRLARRNQQIVEQYNKRIASEKQSLVISQNKQNIQQNELKNAREFLRVEQDKERSLRKQISELSKIATAQARTKVVQLQGELSSTRNTQRDLRSQIRDTEQAARAEIQRIRALDQSTSSMGRHAQQVNSLSRLFRGAVGPAQEFFAAVRFALGPQIAGFAAAGSVMALASSFMQANKEVESLIRGLNAISGGYGVLEFDQLVDTANRLGIALGEANKSFLQLKAAAAGTGLEGEKIQTIFESFANALNVTGADAVTMNRAFRSISQMISKGQIYAEELKGQLAEALPGAIQIFAKALDITPKKLMALVKAGALEGQAMERTLVLVANQLNKVYKVANEQDFTFVQKAALAKNQLELLFVAIGNTGVWDKLGNAMLNIRNLLQSMTDGVPGLSDALTSEWQLITDLFGDDLKTIKTSINSLFKDIDLGVVKQPLLELPVLIKTASIEAITSIKVAAVQAKAAIDAIGGQGSGQQLFDLTGDAVLRIIEAPKTLAQFIGEASAAIGIYADKIGSINQSIVPKGAFRPIYQDLDDFINNARGYIEKNLRPIVIPLGLEDSQRTVADFEKSIRYLQSLIEQDPTSSKSDKYRNDIAALEARIQSERELQQRLTAETITENQRRLVEVNRLNESYNKQKLESYRKLNEQQKQFEQSDTQQQINAIKQQGQAELDRVKSIVEQKNARDDLNQSLRESDRLEKQRMGFNRSYLEQITNTERLNRLQQQSAAISKQQASAEKERLNIQQAYQDTLLDLNSKKYQRWEESGSIAKGSSDFFIQSARVENLRKAWNLAQEYVERYNAELAKGENANQDSVKELKTLADDQLRYAEGKAKEVGDEYKIKQIMEARLGLLDGMKKFQEDINELLRRQEEKQKIETTVNPQGAVDQVPKVQQEAQQKADTLSAIEFKSSIRPPNLSELNTAIDNVQTVKSDGLQNYLARVLELANRYRDVGAMINEAKQKSERFFATQDAANQFLDDLAGAATLTRRNIQAALEPLENGQYKVTFAIAETLDGVKGLVRTVSQAMSDIPATTQVNQSQAVQQGQQAGQAIANSAQQALNQNPVDLQLPNAQELAARTAGNVNASVATDAARQYAITFVNGVALFTQTDLPQKMQQALSGQNFIKPGTVIESAKTTATQFGEAFKTNFDPQVINKNLIDPQNTITQAKEVVALLQGELQALKDSGATNITVTLDQTTGELIITADTSQANDSVDSIIQRIESASPTLKVKVVYDDSGRPNSSVSIPGKAAGGLIPGGYSRRDSYLAMLSPGEFVIPSNIVKKFGPDYFYDFIKNRRQSLKENISVPRFSNGGMMPSAGQPIVINLPGSKPIHLSGSRDAAAQLVKVLTQTGRAL